MTYEKRLVLMEMIVLVEMTAPLTPPYLIFFLISSTVLWTNLVLSHEHLDEL
jgi:hypothetical protein